MPGGSLHRLAWPATLETWTLTIIRTWADGRGTEIFQLMAVCASETMEPDLGSPVSEEWNGQSQQFPFIGAVCMGFAWQSESSRNELAHIWFATAQTRGVTSHSADSNSNNINKGCVHLTNRCWLSACAETSSISSYLVFSCCYTVTPRPVIPVHGSTSFSHK